MAAQHCKFYQVSRVEKHVGVFLVRVNPFHLRPAHIGPVGYGLACAERTLVEIPYNAAQEPVVAGWDAVVVVQGDAGDGIDEDFEFLA